MSLYHNFVEKYSHIRLLHQIERLLSWDQQVCMPEQAVDMRARQLAYITKLRHQEVTSVHYRRNLEEMVDLETGEVKIEDLDPLQAAHLKIWSKDLLQALKLPDTFVQDFDQARIQSLHVWKQAKKTADFSLFAPHLQKMVDMNQQKASYLGYADTPYDALLDLYEPNMTTTQLDSIFDDLIPFVSNLLRKKGNQASEYQSYFEDTFDQKKQLDFAQLMLDLLGVDRMKLHLGLSVHPFCRAIHPRDVRITTNLEGGLLQHVFAVLHEAGHAFYELGFDHNLWATPSAQPVSLGVHESQSKWWEVMVGLSLPFWEYMYPKLQSYFPELSDLSLSGFYQHIHHVQPSCIRIYADELTYPLHVVLRFKIEKQLIEGTLLAKDVPALWNSYMESLLGVLPTHDGVGCLQDIHWSLGSFGYFPTYLLGSMYAVQWFNTFAQQVPNWALDLADGSFTAMREWLRTHIHVHGRRYSAQEMMKDTTGQTISTEPYKEYLAQKYG